MTSFDLNDSGQHKSDPNDAVKDTSTDLFVQYGCGPSAPEGWMNFDSSPTLRLQRLPIIGSFLGRDRIVFPESVGFGDVVQGLPLAENSCAGVYASHVLEHLPLQDFHKAMKETYRILKSGGIFRAIVPDLMYYAQEYIESRAAEKVDANSVFMRSVHLGLEQRPRGLKGVAVALMGNAKHQWMWDEPSLLVQFEAHGFVNVRRAYFNDSSELAYKAVEDPGRFERAIAVEGMKP